MIVDARMRMVPMMRESVSGSPNNITPKITLTIGSKVPRIEVEAVPIVAIALRSKSIEAMVEMTAIPM